MTRHPIFRLAPLCLGLVAAGAAPASNFLIVPVAPGEEWWGGRVVDGPAMPFDDHSELARSLHAYVRGGGNQSTPLLISSQGRFIWNDNPFDFAFVGSDLRLTNAITPWQTGDGGSTLRDAFHAAQRFFPPSGRMPDDLLFTAPQYNTWIELLYDQTEENILRYAHAIIDQGYPPGVLMIDDNWQEDYGVWDFSPRRFHDPKAMVAELHHLGFKVMLWVCPFVSPDSETARALAKQGLLLLDPDRTQDILWANTRNKSALVRWWNGASNLLDLSNPATRGWFQGRLDRLREVYGVDGFKFDAGDSPFYVPESGQAFGSFAPRTPEQHTMDFATVGLSYSLNEYRACWRMAGQPLGQRLRDQDHSWTALQGLIPGILAQGLMGYAFTCPDMIGGGLASAFEDPAKFDPELVVRSAQVHALMPMMQFSVAPWRVLDPEKAAICAGAARLHARFGDFILDLARKSAVSGEPIARPLAWQFPAGGYEKIHDQFMLGDTLMVAPIVQRGGLRRRIEIPPGDWLADDGTTVRGPTTIEVAVPLTRLPYFRLQP